MVDTSDLSFFTKARICSLLTIYVRITFCLSIISHWGHLKSTYHCFLLMFTCNSSVFNGNSWVYSITPHSLLAFTWSFLLICSHNYRNVVSIRARFSTKCFERHWARVCLALIGHHLQLFLRSPIAGLASLPSVVKKVIINDTTFLRVSTSWLWNAICIFINSFTILITSSTLLIMSPVALGVSFHRHNFAISSYRPFKFSRAY